MWVLDKLGFDLLDDYCRSGLNRYSCPWHLGFKTRTITPLVHVLCDIQWVRRLSSQTPTIICEGLVQGQSPSRLQYSLVEDPTFGHGLSCVIPRACCTLRSSREDDRRLPRQPVYLES
jgi:hypothetical protein